MKANVNYFLLKGKEVYVNFFYIKQGFQKSRIFLYYTL